jgi:hypothetical protein
MSEIPSRSGRLRSRSVDSGSMDSHRPNIDRLQIDTDHSGLGYLKPANPEKMNLSERMRLINQFRTHPWHIDIAVDIAKLANSEVMGSGEGRRPSNQYSNQHSRYGVDGSRRLQITGSTRAEQGDVDTKRMQSRSMWDTHEDVGSRRMQSRSIWDENEDVGSKRMLSRSMWDDREDVGSKRMQSRLPWDESDEVRSASRQLSSNAGGAYYDDSLRLRWDEANLYIPADEARILDVSSLKITEPNGPFEYRDTSTDGDEDDEVEFPSNLADLRIDEEDFSKLKIHRESR